MAKPKYMSIDLETRSEVDLGKCGVYKYVEGEDWKILLFCYAFEGDEDVRAVQMGIGEELPQEVLAALEDPEIIKYAWNAAFERVNLSKYLGRRLDPRQWRCTMVWAAELSLPLSLEKAAAAIHADQQKDKAGKDLIRKFSVMQTDRKTKLPYWINPEDQPKAWASFVEYCRQDVRTEFSIHKRLERFPLPDSEWELYHIDQDINDRGVMLDMELVEAAMRCGDEVSERLVGKAKDLTGLDNPNSVTQIKNWLEEHDFPMETLGKDEVENALKNEVPQEARKLLELRLQMSKASVKKYEAAKRCACADSRARGLFQFYGANRTGRFCLTGDHEVLTKDGWRRLDEWQGGCIACWAPTGENVSFQSARSLCFDYEGNMYCYEDVRISQISTPDHKMCVKKFYGGKWSKIKVEMMAALSHPIIQAYRPSADDMRLVPIMHTIFNKPTTIEFSGKVYCAETPTGYFLVRRNGKVWVTGNSGRHIQLQNLRRNSTPALGAARDIIKSGDTEMLEMMYGDPLDILSQCCRTMLVPKPGCEFIVADYSSIEARVLAWLAGEEWTLRAFRDGKDLYCAIASSMFGVPVEKHGANSELRQKGKIATLACIAESEKVLTDRGLVPIQDVTKEMKVWDGEEWVQHDGVVCKGVKPVYRWCGLTATEDHMMLAAPDDIFLLMKYKTFRDVWESHGYYRLVVGEQDGRPAPIGIGHEVITDTASPEFMGFKRVYDIVNAGFYHRYTVSGVIVHNCGYGGGVGAMTAMGALDMGLTEDELPDIVKSYRDANPNIVRFWWDLDRAAMDTIKDHQTHVVGENNRFSPKKVSFEYYSGTLWMVLPSGRRLAYVSPRIGQNRFGGKSIEFLGVGLNNKWDKIETYGAKLSENCIFCGTKILTNEGLISIEKVTHKHKIWDGSEWVSCNGAIFKGYKDVVQIGEDGVWMTSDHMIFTNEGWVECGKASGRLDWADVRLPDRYQPGSEYCPGESEMELPLHMWQDACSGCGAPEESSEGEPENILWVHAKEKYIREANEARHDEASSIWSMAFNDTKMYRTSTPCLEKLWREGNQSLRTLAAQLRELLGRYGTHVSNWFRFGQKRQRGWIQSRKLPLDDQDRESKKHSQECIYRISSRKNDHSRTVRTVWNKPERIAVSTQMGVSDRIVINATRRSEPVYDILNCGPRHQFCAYDPGAGKLRLVHNCTQAVARDILCNSIRNLADEGIDVVAHVHDECICEVPKGKYSVDDICRIMARNPSWCPTLPLTAAGYLAPDYYFKD